MQRYSDTETDKRLTELEKSIFKVYDDANAELTKATADYMANFKKRYEKEYQAFQDGKYTEEQFDAWYMAQVGRGKRWEAMRDSTASRLTNANLVASAYINDTTPGIYSLNANYEAFVIEQITDTADFTLVDAQTVKNLVANNPDILPQTSINVSKDEAWNRKQLTNALTSGIIQGKAPEQIARDFQKVSTMNYRSAIRNARTSVTGAQNAGRQYTCERAEQMGIEVKKEWMATNDERTRESHAELDGVIVGVDEEFPNGLLYPGDPHGAPDEVYNCRCTYRPVLPKYQTQRESRIKGHDGLHDKRSYEAWKDEKIANAKPYTAADATARAMEARN